MVGMDVGVYFYKHLLQNILCLHSVLGITQTNGKERPGEFLVQFLLSRTLAFDTSRYNFFEGIHGFLTTKLHQNPFGCTDYMNFPIASPLFLVSKR